jgi:hypothetical protein
MLISCFKPIISHGHLLSVKSLTSICKNPDATLSFYIKHISLDVNYYFEQDIPQNWENGHLSESYEKSTSKGTNSAEGGASQLPSK